MSTYGEPKDYAFINVHDDEQTAVDAALQVLEKEGGQIIEIKNDSIRLVSFVLNGKTIEFDPNRMFTAKGIKEELEKRKCYNTAAATAISAFATFILSKIPAQTKTLIALHNNTPGHLSVNSYLPGGKEAINAKKILINTEEDADDFFLGTDSLFFNNLNDLPFNIVLQDNVKATDDGSLSIVYGRQHKSYLNVEAEHGHFTKQKEMIEAALSHLSLEASDSAILRH